MQFLKLLAEGGVSDFVFVLRMDLLHLEHVGVTGELLVGTLCLDAAVVHDNDVVSQMNELNGVGHQDPCFAAHQSNEDLLKNLFAHVGVEGGNGVIHNEDVRTLVDGPCERDPCLLTSREVDAFFADLCRVAGRHYGNVGLQLARCDRLYIPELVKLASEEDVFANLPILDPGLLFAVASLAARRDGTGPSEVHREETLLQVAHLSIFDWALIVAHFLDYARREVNHLANHRVQERGLS